MCLSNQEPKFRTFCAGFISASPTPIESIDTLATIPDKTSATLAKFLNKTQVSKHPPPFLRRTMLFMSLKQRSANPPTLNIDLGGQGDFF